MLDLTNALGPKVAAYNKVNPDSPIQLLAKAEFQNPASNSHKDRIARAIITKAEERGELIDENGNKKTSKFRHCSIAYLVASLASLVPLLTPLLFSFLH